jgi:4,5-DOPA dioxygenase extradiol
MNAYRSLFLSHGAPTLAISPDDPAHAFMQRLGRELPKPRAAIVVSPHWRGRGFAVKAPPRFETWHDFSGFPRRMYELQYTPAGNAALAVSVMRAIESAGLPTTLLPDTRLDHGVWVPLMLMWPEADVPLVQVSVSLDDPAAHWALGQALRPFASDGVLIIGSGGIVHNLREISDTAGPAPPWAVEFVQWIMDRLFAGDRAALVDYRQQAPHAELAHPTEEHLLPLFVAAAAGGSAEVLYTGFTFGSLGMAAFGFA